MFNSLEPWTTIAPWFDRLTNYPTSTVSYKTEGSAPFRVFTLEWYRVHTYLTSQTARISFQAKLYESNNSIEFHYGSLEDGSHSLNESASIGIEDAIGGSGHYIDGFTGLSTGGKDTLKSLHIWSFSNNYRFNPQQITTQYFQNVIVDKGAGTTLSLNSNMVINGNFNINNGTVTGPSSAQGYMNLAGNLINNGTFNPGGAKVVLNGTAHQNIGGNSNINFSKLKLNNPAGITLQNNVRVSDSLLMVSGNIDCGPYTLELGNFARFAWNTFVDGRNYFR